MQLPGGLKLFTVPRYLKVLPTFLPTAQHQREEGLCSKQNRAATWREESVVAGRDTGQGAAFPAAFTK